MRLAEDTTVPALMVHRLLPLEGALEVGAEDATSVEVGGRTVRIAAGSATLEAANATVRATGRLTLEGGRAGLDLLGDLSLGAEEGALRLVHDSANAAVLLTGAQALSVNVPMRLAEADVTVGGTDLRSYVHGLVLDAFDDPEYVLRLQDVIQAAIREAQDAAAANTLSDGGPSLF